MRGIRIIRQACGVVLLASLLACGSNPYPSEPKGTLHTYLRDAVKSLDPALADGQFGVLSVLNLYDQLYEYHYTKRPYELKPCLADALPEMSDDALTYTIRLKQGVRYANDPCFPDGKGREVVASDVVFCLKRLMDSRTKSPGRWVLAGRVEGLDAFTEQSAGVRKNPGRDKYTQEEGYPEVAGLKAVDRHTLMIKLVEPYPELRWVLAMPYTSIYPPEAVKYHGKEFGQHGVGSGPYRLESFNGTKHLILVKNENFREAYFPTEGSRQAHERGIMKEAGKRLPLNDRVVATVFREDTPLWLYFQRGYLDRGRIPKDNFGGAVDAATMDLLPEMKARGIRLHVDPKLEVIYDAFNMENEVFGYPAGEKGLALRRAISLANDREWAIEHLYNGRATPMQGPIIEEFPEYDPALKNPWLRQPGETREQALARARKVLADAGMPGGEGVPVLEKDILNDQTSRQHFEAFKRDMSDIGLEFRPYVASWPEFLRRTKEKKASMWGVSWGADYPEAQNFLQLFYGPNSPSPNSSNFNDAKLNELYAQAIRLPPGQERTRLYREIQRIVVDQCPWVFRFRRITFSLMQPWLHGFYYNDISEKYFQYCRVDEGMRDRRVEEMNQPVVWPVFVVLGLFALLIGTTLFSARRTKRGW